ncbi:MAG: FlgO family outer membrane protein, partial [Wenzhouxiangella sp.]|nr:FlgO family outer membrane protein [Wenzhouxiangella sp.]
MSPESSTPINERLDSWKAIANYLGKSVRTAKRWEAEEGLPVHRHMHHRQGTVHAFRPEIDRWLAERGQGPTPPPITQTEDSRPGLMVLPFEHVGPDSKTAWLASGVADALIDRLARTPDLRVMSRTSARIVAGRAEGPTTALRSLVKSHGLSYVVEGTTRADSDDLQVSIRLIDIANDTVVATELFDGKLDQALRIQATIAEHVAAALSKALGQTLTSEGEPEDGPASTAEWQALVLARQDALKWRKPGLDAAVDRLKRAIETLGPRPMLLAALGRTWLQYREAGIEPGPGPLRRARACADELADRDVQHAVRLQLDGWLRYADGNI